MPTFSTKVMIVRKGNHPINDRDKLYYECWILDIDGSTVFHVSCSSFKVKTHELITLEHEVVLTTPVVAPAAQDVANQHSLVDDMSPNIHSKLAQKN